jgi:hypothetical protein
MSKSLNLTNVEALRAYVEDFKDDLIGLMYFGFKTSMAVTPLDGIKGKAYIPTIIINDIVRRYSSTFSAPNDTALLGQREIEVGHGKMEFEIVPTDFETTWMGRFRQKGQDPNDLPFESQIFAKYLAKRIQEQEIAIWTGVKKTVGTTANDPLTDLFDGFIAKIKGDAALLNPTVSGAITASNGVAIVEQMFESLGSQYQVEGAGTTLYVSPADDHLIGRNYRELYGKYNDTSNDGKKSWGIPGLDIAICPGLPKNKLLMTQKENMFYGYDGADDINTLKFFDQIWSIQVGGSFKMGTQTGFNRAEMMAVNDQFII